jgi:hypothetical protein
MILRPSRMATMTKNRQDIMVTMATGLAEASSNRKKPYTLTATWRLALPPMLAVVFLAK